MRSPTSSHRRLHGRAGGSAPLRALAELADHLGAEETRHLLFQVTEEPGGEASLGTKPFDADIHPFDLLAGFTAPAEWSVFGLRVHGTAHHLDVGGSEAISTTYLVDRSGREASRLRSAEGVVDLSGPAEGTLPDLCRRVLGLPTAPPPAATPKALWITVWLDRILEAWSDPDRRRRVSSAWAEVAALHPAIVGEGPSAASLADPAWLVPVARAHSKERSWADLRADPLAVPLPDAQLPHDVAAWMDDGFYARWVLGAFPAPEELVTDVLSLLDDPTRSELRSTLIALLVDAPG
jgi:hypothetical protein